MKTDWPTHETKWVQPKPHLSSLKLRLSFLFKTLTMKRNTYLLCHELHVQIVEFLIFISVMFIFLYNAISNGKTKNKWIQILKHNSIYVVRMCVCVSFQMRQMTITAITTIISTTASATAAAAPMAPKLIHFHKLQHWNAFMFDFLMTTSTLWTPNGTIHDSVSSRAP